MTRCVILTSATIDGKEIDVSKNVKHVKLGSCSNDVYLTVDEIPAWITAFGNNTPTFVSMLNTGAIAIQESQREINIIKTDQVMRGMAFGL